MPRLNANDVSAIAEHLKVTRANLNLASYTPVEYSLPFLEEAFANLEAAIDMLRIARNPGPVFIGFDLAAGVDASAVHSLTT